eukprot:m.14106 g.14106  ORF g.14106 m.14106 type:complete len:607 (+) comp10006_c0_seq1:261-2081(+)
MINNTNAKGQVVALVRLLLFNIVTSGVIGTIPNMHANNDMDLHIRAEDFIFEGKAEFPEVIPSSTARVVSSSESSSTETPPTMPANATTTNIVKELSTTSAQQTTIEQTTTDRATTVPTVATTSSPTSVPTVSPTSMPTVTPTISVSTLRATLDSVMQAIKQTDHVVAFINSDLVTAVQSHGNRSAALVKLTDPIAQCNTNNAQLGMNGECIQAVPRCPTIEVNEGMHIDYTPLNLAHERLAGTIATVSCSNATEYLPRNESLPLVCLTTSLWNGTIPATCTKCAELVDNCSTCSFEGCQSCIAPMSLFQGQCSIPPGLIEDDAARDCDHLQEHNKQSGAYWIRGNANETEAALAYCDQDTLGGGWTLLSTFQERIPEAGHDEVYGSSKTKMWIKGCGTAGSIGCNSQGTNIPGWRVGDKEDHAMHSLDWSVLLEKGERYDLRQTLGIGECMLNAPELANALDVAYTFTYPGFVMQDDADNNTAEGLVWELSNQRVIRDDTRFQWDRRTNNIFFPPWSDEKRGNIVSGGSSYTFEEFPGTFGNIAKGSAGITNVHGYPDPVGAAWFPHMPQDSSTCIIWGPHQAKLQDNWCGKENLQGAYWFRRAR